MFHNTCTQYTVHSPVTPPEYSPPTAIKLLVFTLPVGIHVKLEQPYSCKTPGI